MYGTLLQASQTILEDKEVGKVPRQDDEEVRLPMSGKFEIWFVGTS
ncbi:hypothetical protein MKM42_02405 [Streptococcus suis]|nr:hypothetical protein [Streptococcus suis]